MSKHEAICTIAAAAVLILTTTLSVRAVAQSQGQQQCEQAATAAYQACLKNGIPCVPEMPHCGPHKGSPQECLPAYSAAYARCQPSFNWNQVPAGTTLPGARVGAAYWTAQGTFWMFGGSANQSPPDQRDLWKYTPAAARNTAGIWTEVSSGGVGTPIARHFAASATDAAGNLWLFGGTGHDGVLNDLWEFTPSSGKWKLLSGSAANSAGVYPVPPCPAPAAGSTTTPGGRTSAVAWIDAQGNFWLFGGFAIGCFGGLPAPFNDLWEFKPSAGSWTYIAGSALLPRSGTVPGTSSMPGGRAGASAWTDANGNLWLMGGSGFDNQGNTGALNDLWEFNGSQWSMKAGSATLPAPSGVANGNYGQQAAASASNVPPGRALASAWVDPSGNLWMFGGTSVAQFGFGFSFPTTTTLYGDLWEYQPKTSTWTWIAGPQGPSSAVPVARMGAVVWSVGLADFWLFGGFGITGPGAGPAGVLNDLWQGTGVVY